MLAPLLRAQPGSSASVQFTTGDPHHCSYNRDLNRSGPQSLTMIPFLQVSESARIQLGHFPLVPMIAPQATTLPTLVDSSSHAAQGQSTNLVAELAQLNRANGSVADGLAEDAAGISSGGQAAAAALTQPGMALSPRCNCMLCMHML